LQLIEHARLDEDARLLVRDDHVEHLFFFTSSALKT